MAPAPWQHALWCHFAALGLVHWICVWPIRRPRAPRRFVMAPGPPPFSFYLASPPCYTAWCLTRSDQPGGWLANQKTAGPQAKVSWRLVPPSRLYLASLARLNSSRYTRLPGLSMVYRPACASGAGGERGGKRTGLNGVEARAKAVYRLARAREKMGGWNMSLRGTRAAFTVSTQFSRYEFHGTWPPSPWPAQTMTSFEQSVYTAVQPTSLDRLYTVTSRLKGFQNRNSWRLVPPSYLYLVSPGSPEAGWPGPADLVVG